MKVGGDHAIQSTMIIRMNEVDKNLLSLFVSILDR